MLKPTCSNQNHSSKIGEEKVKVKEFGRQKNKNATDFTDYTNFLKILGQVPGQPVRFDGG